MESPLPGTPVFCIEGRKVGTIESSRDCCMLVLTLESRLVSVRHAAVMASDSAKVSLVCGRTGVARYACATHGAVPATAAS